jgi:hypothetical protein
MSVVQIHLSPPNMPKKGAANVAPFFHHPQPLEKYHDPLQLRPAFASTIKSTLWPKKSLSKHSAAK